MGTFETIANLTGKQKPKLGQRGFIFTLKNNDSIKIRLDLYPNPNQIQIFDQY